MALQKFALNDPDLLAASVYEAGFMPYISPVAIAARIASSKRTPSTLDSVFYKKR